MQRCVELVLRRGDELGEVLSETSLALKDDGVVGPGGREKGRDQESLGREIERVLENLVESGELDVRQRMNGMAA